MYAVIKIGGTQYRVQPGQSLEVNHLQGKAGDTLEFPSLLVVDDKHEVKLGSEALRTKVVATVVSIAKGEKVHVRRFRAKSRYHRHIGFRQLLTKVRIESVGKTQTPTTAVKKSK
jgi:large subunit ribosomal protein L21